MTLEDVEQGTNAQQGDGEHSVEDITREPTPMHSEQPCTMLVCANKVIMPTKKVGCTLVTNHLKKFLEDYPHPQINKLS